MGKWATYQKRGGQAQFGIMAPPGPPPGDWTAVTGAVGVINVTRFVGVPSGATQMLFRAIDQTNQSVPLPGNTVLTGLVSGRAYKVQSSWWNGAIAVSDWSPGIVVNAG